MRMTRQGYRRTSNAALNACDRALGLGRTASNTDRVFTAAASAAAGRTTTIADTAKRLGGLKEATVKRYVRAGKLTATRDESGRIVGITERSLCDYRKAAAAGRRKFAANQFKTAAAYAALAA